MVDAQEGVLLIATTMIALVAFTLTVLAVMVIYRKRRLQHIQEIKDINEKFSRELLQTQLEVQRETMQYIGREIHDNVGQQLTLAFLYTQQIHSDDHDKTGRIQSISTIINDSLTDLRNLSRDLTNPSFSENTLEELVKLECMKVRSTGLVKVTFQSDKKVVEVSHPVKTFAIRILQEFLQNSLKHSGCNLIEVGLCRLNGGIQIDACDNGRGFTIDENNQGIGLRNMKKRASIINADFSVDSSSQGTRMKLIIPNRQLTVNHGTLHRYS